MQHLTLNNSVSTHSRLKAAGELGRTNPFHQCVSTHSRLKAAGFYVHRLLHSKSSFNTQPPKGGWNRGRGLYLIIRIVSTHSRLKAAGRSCWSAMFPVCCFNTQPPKGGWKVACVLDQCLYSFNTQPPKGGWLKSKINTTQTIKVSTHSRLKAAGA